MKKSIEKIYDIFFSERKKYVKDYTPILSSTWFSGIVADQLKDFNTSVLLPIL